jgi:ABC-type nitrate/sulfonate/bicarbonate transport system substrate-binding protein
MKASLTIVATPRSTPMCRAIAMACDLSDRRRRAARLAGAGFRRMILTLSRRIRTACCQLGLRAVGIVVAMLPFGAAIAGDIDLGKVTLRVGDQTGATQSRLRAAGVLEGVPYKIECSVYAAAVNLHEALKAGAIDIGGAGDAPTVSAFAGGSPIKIVAAWTNDGRSTDVLVQHDSPVRSVADLRGRTVSPTISCWSGRSRRRD